MHLHGGCRPLVGTAPALVGAKLAWHCSCAGLLLLRWVPTVGRHCICSGSCQACLALLLCWTTPALVGADRWSARSVIQPRMAWLYCIVLAYRAQSGHAPDPHFPDALGLPAAGRLCLHAAGNPQPACHLG